MNIFGHQKSGKPLILFGSLSILVCKRPKPSVHFLATVWQRQTNGLDEMATRAAGQTINELPSGVFKTLHKVKPMGGLQARRQNTGAVALYWRYSVGTSSERVLIGLYDPSAAPKSLEPTKAGYSVAAATRAAESLAIAHHQNRAKGGHRALVAAERESSQAVAQAR